MRIFVFSIILILFFSLSNCTLDKHFSLDENNRIILATSKAKCEKLQEYGIYSLLFGIYPITNFRPNEYKIGSTFRITEEAQATDFLVTILGGWALTLTRKTRIIEICNENLYISKSNPAEEKYADSLIQKHSINSKVKIVMNDNQTFTGRILGFTEKSIICELLIPSESEDRIDILHLKDGHILEGKLETQNEEIVEFLVQNQLRKIPKANVSKLQLNSPIIHKEKRELVKSEIKNVMFEETGIPSL